MDEKIYRLWYSLFPAKFKSKLRRLYASAGSISAVYNAKTADYVGWGVTDIRLLQLLADKDTSAAEKEKWYADNYGAEIIAQTDSEYPQLLKGISDAPLMLYRRGSAAAAADALNIAVVGTRNATENGKNLAYGISRRLAKNGVCIVSGMAAGIDTCAHSGAIDGGGTTAAVFGCGVATAYPASNKPLMQKIIKNGCVYSEYPIESTAYPSNFAERNRIVSGMCSGTVVIEAGENSGSFITARLAAKQNRDLFITDFAVRNEKIRKIAEKLGAVIISSADDILTHYKLKASPGKAAAQKEENMPDERQAAVLKCINEGVVYAPEIAEKTGETPVETDILLTFMELEGRVVKMPDGSYAEND